MDFNSLKIKIEHNHDINEKAIGDHADQKIKVCFCSMFYEYLFTVCAGGVQFVTATVSVP